MKVPGHIIWTPSRRHFLQSAGILSGIAATFPTLADTYIDLDLPGGPDKRELTTAFPQKAQMIVQRTRPPLLRLLGLSTTAASSLPTNNSSCAGIGR